MFIIGKNVTFFISAITFKENITGVVMLMEYFLTTDEHQLKNIYLHHRFLNLVHLNHLEGLFQNNWLGLTLWLIR